MTTASVRWLRLTRPTGHLVPPGGDELMRLRRHTRAEQVANATSTDPRIADAATALTHAGRLAAEHAYREAIDLLAAAFRRLDEDELAVALVDLRVEAARANGAGEGRSPWPPEYKDPFPGNRGRLPEIAVDELTAEMLGGAVLHHGALVVRGVLGSEGVRVAIEAIQRAHARRDLDGDRAMDDEPDRANGVHAEDGWYRPVPFHGDNKSIVMNTALRRFVHKDGGVWLADSPRATATFLDQLTACGVIDAISRYFGEQPFISVQKSTLRRSSTAKRINIPWHQDGSFLGEQVRTMNVWLALSRCGGNYPSPGLEVAPFRVHVLPAGDGLSPIAVNRELVAEVTSEFPAVVPEFEPGDGMIFDECFLHRTYVTPHMTEDRYAIECWFFAPSHPAAEYLPVVV